MQEGGTESTPTQSIPTVTNADVSSGHQSETLTRKLRSASRWTQTQEDQEDISRLPGNSEGFDSIAGKCLNRLPRLPKRESYKMSDVVLDSAQNPRASISRCGTVCGNPGVK